MVSILNKIVTDQVEVVEHQEVKMEVKVKNNFLIYLKIQIEEVK
jgi:hypothetical protein